MPHTDGLLESMLKNKISEHLDEEAENSDGIDRTVAELAKLFVNDRGKMY